MHVYRIAKKRFIKDLSGEGASTYGGRWNLKGTTLIYTAENRSLAALELLVRLGLTNLPSNLSIATLHIPDNLAPKVISMSELPNNWSDYPAPLELAKIGTNWVKKNTSLLLKVPSAIINEEFNVLINPEHSDIKRVKIEDVKAFKYDDRLFKKSD